MTAAGGQSGEGPQNNGGIPPENGGYPPSPGWAYPAYDPAYGTPAYPPYEQPASAPPGFELPPYPPEPPYPPAVQYGPPPPGGYGPPPPVLPPPPGYPPPPPPYGGGYPGAPYPGAFDYRMGHPAAPPATNTLAILSILASVLGLACAISSIAGIVLGGIAINQIRRTNQEGYGLAVAGIVIGIATLLIYLVFLTFAPVL